MKRCYFILVLFLVSSKLYGQSGQNIDTVYTYVEEMPAFDGDYQWYIRKHTHYPNDARKKHIEGKVTLRFIITKNGDIDSVIIVKSVYPSLDEEAMRVVREMPKWKPAYMHGKPVNVWYTVPINFKL